MLSRPDGTRRPTFRSVLRSFGRDGSWPLADLLTQEHVQQAGEAAEAWSDRGGRHPAPGARRRAGAAGARARSPCATSA